MSKKDQRKKTDSLGRQVSDLQDELTAKNIIISKLKRLIEVNQVVTKSLQRDEVLGAILDQTRVLMECSHSSILLVDPVTNKLRFEVFTDEKERDALSRVQLNKGEGIAGTVWQNGTPLLIDDVGNDRRFSKKADKQTRVKTSSIIAVPLITAGKVIGVMEAINKCNSCFDYFDMELFQHLAVQAAVALENARLYEMAITDGMTGLFIHRYFKNRLISELQRARRYKTSLALIIFDIDHFKGVNDTYGHQMGDEVLKRVASVIQDNSRTSDIPCRYGGEEFSVVLPETDRSGATIFAEKIRSRIESMRVEYAGGVINVTISAGIAVFPEHHCEVSDELVRMADIGLYHSKESGRNRITVYSDDLEHGPKNRGES
jgi:diguanylate cyclase (GGDEF)-like protein